MQSHEVHDFPDTLILSHSENDTGFKNKLFKLPVKGLYFNGELTDIRIEDHKEGAQEAWNKEVVLAIWIPETISKDNPPFNMS